MIKAVSDSMDAIEDTVRRLTSGIRDPIAAKNARDRMQVMREQMKKQIGEVELAVDLIRETRE